MAETTHGGLSNLTGGKGNIMDYGSLMVTTLQRASSAREAVRIVAELTDKYGYASSMEGFSISDGSECWYMELIGKGNLGKGLLWVALRVPDGYFTANANQARITSFLPCDDPDRCMMADDVVTFAIAHGLWAGGPTDPSFSFSGVYDPVTTFGARFCEARVWYIFQQLADPADFNASYYLPYAQGFNLTRRMPLWVRPRRKLARADVHALLSSKYEASWFDPSLDTGAGAEHSPYRWNGLSWSLDEKSYVNERVVGTQFTAWHFVASVRGPAVPPPMRALLWFGADDHAYAPKVPLFGGATAVAPSFDDADCMARLACREQHGLKGSTLDFSWDDAFWVASSVARLVYLDPSRAAPVVACARATFERWAAPEVAAAKEAAQKRFEAGDDAAGVAILTNLSVTAGNEATSRWQQLWRHLMVTFQDGSSASAAPDNLLCGCEKQTPTFSDTWLRKVVADTGDRYRMPDAACAWIDPDGHCHPHPPTHDLGERHGMQPIPKLEVRGVVGRSQQEAGDTSLRETPVGGCRAGVSLQDLKAKFIMPAAAIALPREGTTCCR